VSAKNNQQVRRAGGRTFVTASDRALAWKDAAQAHIRAQWDRKKHPAATLWLTVVTYLDGGHSIDLDNLYGAPQDVLQRVGVIEDDKYVECHDGSRRFRRPIKIVERDVAGRLVASSDLDSEGVWLRVVSGDDIANLQAPQCFEIKP
jgi:Holliday junction resolvase RusA-like endonuclease